MVSNHVIIGVLGPELGLCAALWRIVESLFWSRVMDEKDKETYKRPRRNVSKMLGDRYSSRNLLIFKGTRK